MLSAKGVWAWGAWKSAEAGRTGRKICVAGAW